VAFLWKIFMKSLFINLPEVQKMFSFSRSTVYQRVAEKILPPPIKLGSERAIAWLKTELDAVIDLMIKGASNSEIQELVSDLLDNRKGVKNEITNGNTIKTCFNKYRNIPYLTGCINGLIPNKGIGIISGEDGDLNTSLAVELAAHVAHDVNWQGRRIHQVPTMYCSAGKFNTNILDMKELWRKKHSVNTESPFYISSIPLNLLNDFQTQKWINRFTEYLQSEGRDLYPGVLFIDIQDFFPQNYINISNVSLLIHGARCICEILGLSVVFVFNKGNTTNSPNFLNLLQKVDFSINVKAISSGACLTLSQGYNLSVKEKVNIKLSCVDQDKKNTDVSPSVDKKQCLTVNHYYFCEE
jgi:predicted DNA-binding transcriptional regulator AlpA